MLASALLGCSSSPDHAAALDVGEADGGVMPVPTSEACETPAEGCGCPKPGQTVSCGQVERRSGEYVACSMGVRTCSDDKWGACVGDRVATLSVPAGLQRTRALGSGNACVDNPCDPYCRVVVDDPVGLDLPDGGALTEDGGLQVLPHEASGGGLCTSMTVSPTPQTLTVTGLDSSGLFGEYFDQVDKNAPQISPAWQPAGTRRDLSIDFDWGTGSPGVAALGDDNFSVRWTGTISAQTSEAYTLCATTDDGERIWVDDVLVSQAWYDHSADELCSAPMNWMAGAKHKLRVEYYEAGGIASAKLKWKTATIPEQVVPASAFGSPTGTQAPNVAGSAKFQVTMSPAGCYPGTPQPAWTLDRLDLATIDMTGEVKLISAVGGPITATAFVGPLSASGVVNVVVDIKGNDAAPSGTVAAFNAAASGTDPAKIVYPYDQTVLPLGLRAPLLQWLTGGMAATATKVSLRYPATGAASFQWSAIAPESNPPQVTVPRTIWKYFEQSAKGQSATFSVQRLVGGVPRPAMTRTLNFSSAPMRGKIYYTQYERGANNGKEMVTDPGSEDPSLPAFGTSENCPVCHTLSASGNVFATAARVGLDNGGNTQTFSNTLGGISTVNANGSLTPIADFVPNPMRANYTVGTQDWRGFAWSPLTPDGKYALAANNVWGNTFQALVGIDATTRKVNTGSTMMSGGTGTGLLAQYFPSLDYTGAAWKRFEPQVNFDFGAASPGALITTDYSVRRAGLVQPFFNETYKFEVVTSDAVTLTVGSAAPVSGTGTVVLNTALTTGTLAPILLDEINTTGSSTVQLFWSSPSTPRALVPQSQLFPPASEPQHGALVVYKDDATGVTSSRLEPDIASNYAAHAPTRPSVGIAADKWSSTWDAQVESPYSGPVAICVDANDQAIVTVDGIEVLNKTAAFNGCTPDLTPAWAVGSKHSVHIAHHEDTGNARMILKYKYGGVTEVIPSANLYPLGYAPPTTGLTATYYDVDGFNTALSANQTNPRAFQRIDPNIDFDWGDGRPNYSTISNDDTYSARWTGSVLLACSGVFEFRSNGNIDDGGRLWVDGTRVMSRWNAGALYGAAYLEAGAHDFKFDFNEQTLNATAQLQWKTPCAGSPGWVTMPSSVFTPNSSYTRATGFVIDGGDNGNNTNYWVWQMPTSASPTPVDVTSARNGAWGLAGTSLMVPTFAPDGSKLVFIDGDSGGGAGWRKGLSVFDFDQGAKLFKNRKLVTSTWPLGDVMKWPTFESDSQSVIYQTTVPGDSCCRRPDSPPGTGWTKYGYMGPTNYYEDPGRLWSVDTQSAASAPVELRKLNSGERAQDANKAYQPTMLPVAAGGYRWVVFTSTRPYGNLVNQPAVQQDFSNTATYASSSYTAITNYQDIQSQLWVSAVDDTVSGAADRSHPGFWLPSQNFAANAATGFINERAFWVLAACHTAGKTAASTCEVDEDCCGGSGAAKTAACRLDTPISNPPVRHCQTLPPAGTCSAESNSCVSSAECCAGLVCVGAACAVPPPVLVVSPSNYERVYKSDCPDGTKVVWRIFDWKAEIPPTNSRLEVFAQTATDPGLFATLPVAPNPNTFKDVVKIVAGDITTSNLTQFVGTNPTVDDALGPDRKSQVYLKITVRFVPNDERTLSPILKDWRMSYSCVPAE